MDNEDDSKFSLRLSKATKRAKDLTLDNVMDLFEELLSFHHSASTLRSPTRLLDVLEERIAHVVQADITKGEEEKRKEKKRVSRGKPTGVQKLKDLQVKSLSHATVKRLH